MAVKKLFSFSDITKVLGNQVTNPGRYLLYLEEKDVIQKTERGIYTFIDPIFKRWLEKKF